MNNSWNPAQQKLVGQLNNPWKLRLFFWQKLPSAWFWRLRVHALQPQALTIALPHRRTTLNPFGSAYFAAQIGAAELSTGLLAILAARQSEQSVSMYVLHVEGSFVKRGMEDVFFTCEDGDAIHAAIAKTMETGEPVEVKARSTGKLANGDVISDFYFSWTFKRK